MWIVMACGRFAAGAVESPVDRSVEVSQALRSGAARGAHGSVSPRSVNSFSTARRESTSEEMRRAGPPAGVQDGGVVAPAELPADRRQRGAGELAREVHRELARPGDARRAPAREELLGRDPEVAAGGGLDLADRVPRGTRGSGRAGRGCRAPRSASSAVSGPAGERAEGDDPDQRALERAHVALDVLGDRLERRVVGELDAVVLRALAQDRQAGGEVGRRDVGDEARPRSARAAGPRAPGGRGAGGRR